MTKYVHVPSNIGLSMLGFTYHLGADYEPEGARGISHLMEHLMCKPFDHLRPKMKRLGINYTASTSTDRITFAFGGIDENLATLSKELYETVTKGKFTWTKEDFEVEKSTVLQEYADAFNEQVEGSLDNLIRKHWNHFGPIGYSPEIEAFSYEDSLQAREKFAHPAIVCEVGTRSVTLEQINVNQPAIVRAPLFGSYEVPQEVVPRGKRVLVGLMGTQPIAKAETNRVILVLDCLNDGLEAPLYQEIREIRGLSYCSAGFLFPVYGARAISLFALTSKREAKKLAKVYREFFSGDLSRHISKDRFEDCYSNTMIQKIVGDRLPHTGAYQTVLNDSPYEGLEGFNYDDAINVLNEHFKLERFEEILG